VRLPEGFERDRIFNSPAGGCQEITRSSTLSHQHFRTRSDDTTFN
jgi:hypothetical protein